MRLGKRYLPLILLAAALGVAAAITTGPPTGTASGASPSFTASDYQWRVSGTNDTTLTIAPGGTVTFSYPSGASTHNADFGSGPAPSSCTQTAGASSGAVPPLPHQPTAPGWSGTCTFTAAGTYTFHCDFHSFMSGTIVVSDSSTTTASTSTSSNTTSPTSSTTTSATTPNPPGLSSTSGTGGVSGGGPPAGGPHAHVLANPLAVAARQRGASVRGTVRVDVAGSRLQVDLLAAQAFAAGKPIHGRGQLVGRLVRRSQPAGVVHFVVELSPAARRALRRRRRLSLTVVVTLTAPHGRAVAHSSRVTLTG